MKVSKFQSIEFKTQGTCGTNTYQIAIDAWWAPLKHTVAAYGPVVLNFFPEGSQIQTDDFVREPD